LEYAWGETLLSTHLLPSARAGGPDGPELSGLNGPNDGKLTPLPVITWESVESDEMRVVRKRIPFQESGRINLPGSASGRNFVPEICAGFREVAENTPRWGSRLLSSPIWQQLCGETSRYVAWRSMHYAKLLQDGCHPNLLRDAMDREAFFDTLWSRDLQEEVKDSIIRSERQDLWNEDIPVFFSQPQDSNIYSHNGTSVRIPGFETTQTAATKRLTSFSQDAIERHCWTIKTAFRASAQVTAERLLDGDVWKPEICTRDSLETTCLSVARQIADRILSLRFFQDNQVFWVDTLDIPIGQDRLVFAGPTSVELYSGLAGFLAFLTAAGERLHDQRYKRTCSAIARTICPILGRKRKAEAPFLGGFVGDCAALYAASHALFADPEQTDLRAACGAGLESVKQAIPNDTTYDIVGGSAGAICVLLSLYAITGNKLCLELAQLCGDHLLRSVISAKQGVAWKTIVNSATLSGFAHGSAGIAYALFYLSKATKNEGYADIAKAAVLHDRSTYSPDHQNWLDLRDNVEDRDFVGWCYGAPGVGLSRLAQMGFGYGDDLCPIEVEIAVNKTIKTELPAHHLCHGAFGNIEFVLLAAERMHRPEWQEAANLMIKRTLEQVMDLGFQFEGDSEVLNLMLGLCGVGHVLLRAASSQPMPCVLLLEPPLIP
ncbi:MAG TPA: type 2 lanthipeptide synthetase LanM, partial [Verrucomicrobiae bacterium]|nr:type 2 lanthipeptide synthetase LanM [Verrucomicrobiae bacterium]